MCFSAINVGSIFGAILFSVRLFIMKGRGAGLNAACGGTFEDFDTY
jgi:hypothetical protein